MVQQCFSLLAVLVVLSGQLAVCDYMVEVDLRSYINEDSRASGNSGECCDSVSANSHDFNDGTCTNTERCDNQFVFCLRAANTPSTNPGGCVTQTILSTNVLPDTDSLDFSSVDIGVPNPMSFTVAGNWNGAQLYIVVLDLDQEAQNGNDLVDRFLIELPNNLLDSTGLTLTRFGGVEDYGRITLSASVYCASNYHGNSCEFVNVCESGSATCSGRGLCTPLMNSSSCSCTSGYTGLECELVDHCFEQTCSDNGVCTNEESSYTCACNPGFTGANCSVNIDDCEGIVCSNNGECVDETNDYHCECYPGFKGLNCTVDINDCIAQNCSNNGQCIDGVNSYSCLCHPGYTGSDCQLDIDNCEYQNCSGNGDCIDELNSYSCVCENGFTGSDCDININDCFVEACNKVGKCLDGVDSFVCECDPPFTGLLCDEVDYCFNVNCNGNGVCVSGESNFTCECQPGFTGELCSSSNQSQESRDEVIVEALVGGVTAALVLLVVIVVLLLGAIGCLVRKRKTIITTYFPNGATSNGECGVPNNSLDRSVKQSNTMRSDNAEFENTLYASMQSAEICNPDYGDTDVKKIPYHKNNTQ